MSEVITMIESEPKRDRAPARVPMSEAPTPMHMLQIAVSQGADIDRLEKLMELAQRWEANEARKAFTAAMAAFKSNPPAILKDRHVAYTNSKGTVTEYDHASLGAVCAAIVKGLSEHGLSHRWETLQSGENIKVICHVTHAAGHTESTALHSLSDTSGGKNDIQALASAVTYLQRYTLLAATGLAVEDGSDDDARRAGGKVEELVTREQAANIEALITEVKADRPRFLAWLDVASIEKIPAAKYADAVRMLEQKRGRS